MKHILRTIISFILSIFLLSQFIPAFVVKKEFNSLVIASLILMLFLNIIKPVLNIIMLPLNLVTLNLTVWITDVILMIAWTIVTPGVSIVAWNFPGTKIGPFAVNSMNLASWQVTLVCCILLTLMLKLFNWLCK